MNKLKKNKNNNRKWMGGQWEIRSDDANALINYNNNNNT